LSSPSTASRFTVRADERKDERSAGDSALTALLSTPATDPPARGVIENYRLVKPEIEQRSNESVPVLEQAVVPLSHVSQPAAAERHAE